MSNDGGAGIDYFEKMLNPIKKPLCKRCDGAGEIEYLMMGEPHYKDCPACNGNGVV